MRRQGEEDERHRDTAAAEALKPAREMAEASCRSAGRARAPIIARRGPPCWPRRSSFAARSSASPSSAARCRRARSRRTIASSTSRGTSSASSTCSAGTTRCSPISGCSGPSASGPARCAPRSSARSTFPRPTSSSGSRSPSSAARRSRASSPSPASAAGATSNSTRRSATIIARDVHALSDGGEGAAVHGLAARRRSRCGCSGRPRAARRPPIRASTRIWRPIRRRSGTSSTGRPSGRGTDWYPKLEY